MDRLKVIFLGFTLIGLVFSQSFEKLSPKVKEFVIISDDEFTSAYIEKGKLLEKEGKYNEAINNYKISIRLNEPNSFIIMRIGLCYLKLKNYKLCVF